MLAGCAQSMPWAKMYLFDLISHAHRSFPLVNLRSYVDDMSHTQHGSDISLMCDTLVPAAAQLARGLEALDCVIRKGFAPCRRPLLSDNGPWKS
eukprot:1044320-Pyramimonas_sp.AAC.1